jgi:hypothetical protein
MPNNSAQFSLDGIITRMNRRQLIALCGEEIEMAMDDIDEDQLRPHSEPTKADFICDAKYA